MKQASLNHVYRVIWSHVLRTWVVVAENVRGRGKSSSRKLVAAALALTAGLAQAGPGGGQVTSGAGSIAQSANTTTINQSSQSLSINWQSFNVGSQETVNFLQPSASAIAVNRIAGNNGSVILGHINANGQVYLINPNGILFGEGAQVNVGGLVASALDINDSAAAGNTRAFSGNGSGSVINQGTINANGGYVALIGNHVANQGTITAQMGSVAMGAGNAVTLSFNGNSLVHMQVDKSVLQSLAENGGLIKADGGQVIMTAGAKNSLLASVVNNTGVIEARTVENHNGTIELLGGMSAGTVNVGGTLDASAPNGGDGGVIETSAANVKVANGTNISTLAAHGKSGRWLIDPTDFTIASDGSGDITGAQLSANLGGGNVTIQSSSGTGGNSGNVNVNDVVSWSANQLTLSAQNNININANLNGSGTASLALQFGQGAIAAGNTSNYYLNNGAQVNLPAGQIFSTLFGSDGVVTNYMVITSLGSAGDGTTVPGIATLQSVTASSNFVLGANIDASATSGWNNGAGFTPIGNANARYTGTFDGLGHTISNLTINLPNSSNDTGLFGVTGSRAVIQNVGLVGESVTGSSVSGTVGTGGLVGTNNGTINNSYVSGNVTSAQWMIGGLVGQNFGTINGSYVQGSVSGTGFNADTSGQGIVVGGLVGQNYGSINNSHASASVSGNIVVGGLVGDNAGGGGPKATINGSYASGTVSAQGFAGGLVGENFGIVNNSHASGDLGGTGNSPFAMGGLAGSNTGMINDSYANGNVVNGSNSGYIGGLVGENSGTVSNSYSSGAVSGGQTVGGLVGSNFGNGVINDSYALGSVSGSSYVGGLVGNNNYGKISDVYSVGAVSGTSNVGGLIGSNSGAVTNGYWDTTKSGQGTSAGGNGLTTTQMQSGSNFSGFNFTTSPGASGNSWVMIDVDGTLNNASGALGGTFPMLSSEYSTKITNAHQLQLMSMAISASYVLAADIDASATDTKTGNLISGIWSTAGGFVPIGGSRDFFQGTFDGQGHTINNLTINLPNSNGVGLIRAIDVGAVVQNVGLVNGSITGSDFVGALAGKNNGLINNSYSSASVIGSTSGGSWMGGLVGQNYYGTISNSFATGNVTPIYGGQGVGGLAGTNYGSILNSHASGNVGVAGGSSGVGGLVGNGRGTISQSYATGNVSGNQNVGGLIGSSGATISNSFATGNVTTYGYFGGGLVGTNSGTIIKSYATGALSAPEYGGGLVGYNPGTIINSYASVVVNGGSYAGGLVGQNLGSIVSSYAVGTVYGGMFVGGLVGYNTGAVANSYASATVMHNSSISGNFFGGLAGFNSGSISDSYANGSVTGSLGGTETLGASQVVIAPSANVGALLGSNYNGTVTNNFYDKSVNPNLPGIAGQHDAAGVVWGMSTVDMQLQANFTSATPANGNVNPGWDFASGRTWNTSPTINGGYPYLCAIAGGCVLRTVTIYVDPISGSSIYGHMTTIGYVLDTSPIIGSGTVITDAAATGTILWSGAPTSTANVGSYQFAYSGGLSLGNQNYSLAAGNGATWNVTPATLTVSGQFASNKVYDGTNTAQMFGGTLVGLVNGDNLTLNTSGVFPSKNVGNGLNVTATDTLGGTAALNYNLLQPTGLTANITPASLSISGQLAANKVYDGTTGASLSGGTLSGIIAGDNLSLTQAGNFTSKNAGAGVAVNAANTISGSDAGNYVLVQPTGLSANITSASLVVIGETAGNKVYDGTTAAPLSGGTLSGVVTGDYVTLVQAGSFASKNVATGISVNAADTIGGADAGNYTLTQPTGLAANITRASLAVAGQTAANKIYDGTTNATLSGGTLSGVFAGDTVTLTQAGSFVSKNAGTGVGVTVTDSIGGAAAGNYIVVEPANVVANITPLALTVNATGSNRVYNGSVNDAVTLSTAGIIAGDTVGINDISATFANKNIGTSKVVSVSGISLSGSDAGNYTLVSTTATTSANITPATLTVTGETAASKVYNGNATDTLSGGSLVGVISGDSVTLTQAGTFASKNVGTGLTVTAADSLGGTGAGNYTLVEPTGLVANITPASLTVIGESAANRVYNGGTVATLTGGNLSGVISGDSVTLNQAGSFASKNVGNSIVVTAADTLSGTDAGNYTVVQPSRLTANITPLAVTVVATGNNIVYNGTTSDTVTLTSSGVVAGDAVTFTDSAATFASKNVGTNLAVNVIGINMSGADAGNYTLTNRNATTSASITPATLTVTGEAAATKVYNGSTATTLSGGQLVGLMAGDHLTLTQAGSFASKNAGTGVAVNVNDTVTGTGATNYALMQPTGVVGNITPATITVTASGTSKVYDGTVNDSVKLSSSGIVTGDVVTISDSSATFAGKNVGTNLAVTVSGLSMSGADAGNYKLASQSAIASASITPAPLTVTGETAADKVYNGTTAATLNGGSLVGVLAGDSVTLNQAGSFASKNVGTNVAVTVADTLGGAAAANYKLVEPASVTASITPLSITVAGETATNRVYNGTTVDPLTGGSLVGAIAGDAVTLVQTGTFASKNVGTGIAVTVADSLAGTSAGNYTLVQPTGTLHANITPLAITVAASGTNMVYNGTVNDTVKLTGTGVIAGDAVSFSDTSATFAGKNVGTGVRVSVSGISMTGTDAGNYTLGNTTATTSANITPAALTVTGESAATRTYNGTTAATLSGGVLNGLIAGDSVTLNLAGTFVSKNAGVGVAVTTADTISGTGASNYTLVQPTNVTGTITQAVLTVIGQRATDIVYNGSTLDPLTAGHLQGVLPGDVVTLISLGNFISPNIGIAIPVIVSDTLSGASAGNYILTQPTGLSANITKP